MRHILRVFLTLSVVLATVGMTLPAAADPADESQFVALINQSRSEAGLGALAVFWDLTDDARVHTAEMISAGQIYHSSNAQLGAYSTGWARLGENVGMGPNPSLLHQAFLNSPSHRANILGDYDLVGVGVDRAPDGTMFVTVVFMMSAAPPTTTTTAPPTTTPPVTAAPTTTTTTAPPTTTPPATAPETTVAAATAPPTTGPTVTSTTVSEATPEVGVQQTPKIGERPATKASGTITDRRVISFRPVFSLLDTADSDPIVVLTSNGFPLVIE
jgi:hypothetical protein